MLIIINSMWHPIETSIEDWVFYEKQCESLICSSPDLETGLSQPQYLGQLFLDDLACWMYIKWRSSYEFNAPNDGLLMGPDDPIRSGSSGSHLGGIERRKEVPENRNKFHFHLNAAKRQTAPVQFGRPAAGSDSRQKNKTAKKNVNV